MNKLIPAIILLVSALLLSGRTFAQTQALTFSSTLEQNAFEQVSKSDYDKMTLLLAIDPAATDSDISAANAKLEALYRELDTKKVFAKPLSKSLKIVFEATHRHFLKKYEDNASFYQTMKSGTYNCVGATALYALIFEHYNIAYQIKQLPTHVYLVADPAFYNIQVETTDPRGGYFVPDPKFKKSYIDYLIKSKIISEEEGNTQSTDVLFNKHYQNNTNISFEQLASYQYSNTGIQQFSEQNYKGARSYFQKAHQLNPSHEIKYMLHITTHNTLVSATYEKPEEIQLLIEYYNFQPEQVNRDNFINDFKIITDKVLINKADTSYYRTVYNLFKTELQDSLALNEISFIYYMQLGRVKYLQNRNTEAMNLMATAYGYNSSNLELQSIMVSMIMDQLRFKSDSKAILAMVHQHVEKFPFLNGNPHIEEVLLNMYLKTAFDFYEKNNMKEGRRYLSSFEEKYATKATDVQHEFIERAYTSAWGAYIRAKNKPLAMQVAKKGLAILPQSSQMKDLVSWSK